VSFSQIVFNGFFKANRHCPAKALIEPRSGFSIDKHYASWLAGFFQSPIYYRLTTGGAGKLIVFLLSESSWT
jgi:hypothetical protein